MKKIISFILVLSVVLCFAACNGSGGLKNQEGDGVAITLFADKTSVAPGEELVIAVNVKDAQFAACFDLFVETDSDASFVKVRQGKNLGEFMVEGNQQVIDGKEGVYIGGMISTALTLSDHDVANITYQIPENAKIGEKYNFNIRCDSFDVSYDESGNEIYSVMEDMALTGVTVVIAEESVKADRNAEATTAAETTEETETEETTEEVTSEETTSGEDEEASEEIADEALSSEEETDEEETTGEAAEEATDEVVE